MTQEEKQLLLKDITTRLPYQPMCEFTDTEDDFCKTTEKLGYSLRDFIDGKVIIKPYLRPMSNMTEDEEKEYRALNCYEGLFPRNEEALDYVLEHHFDYRGLIPIGLGIDCTGLNIYENEKSI